MIIKQQRVIKKLLRPDNGAQQEHYPASQTGAADSSGSEANGSQTEAASAQIRLMGVNDFDGLNDSDSAIMLEDHITEVTQGK